MTNKTSVFLFALLCFACCFAKAQVNGRYDGPFPSVSSSTVTPFLVANIPPNSPKLAVCNSPANQVPCTNYATTYTSAGVACSNGAQDTPQPQPSACQNTGDAQGNIGFWAAPGTYEFTVCIATTCFGPYRTILTVPDNHGSCTMSSGTCSLITFGTAYLNTPICTVTWTGSGTLTGFLKTQRSTTGLQPASSVNTDTAVVDWKCQGNPN